MERERKKISIVILFLCTIFILGLSIYIRLKPEKGVTKLDVAGYESLGIIEASKITDDSLGTEVYKVIVEAQGYSAVSPIRLAVTFDSSLSKVLALEILSHKEIENIGSKIMNDDFLLQFIGVNLPFYIAVEKTNPSTENKTNPSTENKTNTSAENTINHYVKLYDACMKRAAITDGTETVNQLTLNDGVYSERASEEAAAESGYYSQVILTVEDGKITSAAWDCFDSEGNSKTLLSENGQYVMTDDGLLWSEQARILAEYVIEKQGTAGLNLDSSGRTDAVSGVSINIESFINQAEACLKRAAEEQDALSGIILTENTEFEDGVYVERAAAADAAAENGYYSQVILTIEAGKITSAAWDCFDEFGNSKSLLSETGQYVMTDNGLLWSEQAEALADYVLEQQGIKGLNLDSSGRTDAVSGVSININGFVSQVETCLKRAAAKKAASENEASSGAGLLQDGVYVEKSTEADDGYYSQLILTVEDGNISSVVWDCVDSSGIGKAVLSEAGRYIMTDKGLLWSEQAKALAQYAVENQGIEGLTVNSSGKTDVIAGVSININSFIEQASACLERAAKAKNAVSSVTLSDGEFTVEKEAPEGGYANEVKITVSNGRIASVIWDSYNEKGSKHILSQNGEYVMTEYGAAWSEQAEALATYVIENQGLRGLEVNSNGKTDAIATVSIDITDFIELVTECLSKAAGGSGAVMAEPTMIPEPAVTAPASLEEKEEKLDGTAIDGITGATISSKAVIKGINNAYEFLLNIS